jgi:hypothetical protein
VRALYASEGGPRWCDKYTIRAVNPRALGLAVIWNPNTIRQDFEWENGDNSYFL